ncbi:hypothetical protein NW754_002042 [Fusarium falciforme]|nr:hypothetical protein NW754_002042 [Fusarium falciforme]
MPPHTPCPRPRTILKMVTTNQTYHMKPTSTHSTTDHMPRRSHLKPSASVAHHLLDQVEDVLDLEELTQGKVLARLVSLVRTLARHARQLICDTRADTPDVLFQLWTSLACEPIC